MLATIGIKEIDFENRLFVYNKKNKATDIQEEVMLAFEGHFRPILLEAQKLADQNADQDVCMHL